MANDYSVIVPQMLAMGVETLRERLVLPRLSLQRYEYEPGKKGSTVEVPFPDALTAEDVTPGHAPVAPQDSSPTVKNIPVDQWKESSFGVTDKELVEARQDWMRMQSAEAVKAVCNAIESHLWGVINAGLPTMDVSHGTAGTTPFAADANGIGDISVALGARSRLDDALAPDEPRSVIINPDAEANLLQQRRFADISYVGDNKGIIRGMMGSRFGLDWVKTQTVPRTTGAALAGFQLDGAVAIGDTAIDIDKGATTFVSGPKVGDVFTIAGDTTQYMVRTVPADKAATSTTEIEIEVTPAIKAVSPDNAALTAVPYSTNLIMHRDFLAFVSKPLIDDQGMEMTRKAGGFVESFTDPVSGCTLRAMLVRQHYQWRFSFDVLWGAAILREEFGRRIFG